MTFVANLLRPREETVDALAAGRKGPTRIATFGSCLSRFTANAYRRLFRKATVVGSVYHNRIDRFLDCYVDRTAVELPRAAFDGYAFEGRGGQRARIMLENQWADGTLGKHAEADDPGFMAALQTPVDLILCDNFVDLCAKLQRRSKGGGAPMFFNRKDLPDSAGDFELERDYLPIDRALALWGRMGAWLRAQQPGATIIFMNFPYDHHPNPAMQRRSRDFSEAFTSDEMRVVPRLAVHPSMIRTSSHFSDEQYAMYAGLVRTIQLRKKEATPLLEDGDEALRD